MSDKKKPLPRPPSTPFGRKKRTEDADQPLLADKMAMAMAEGNLEEFLEKEMPGNENAQKLAMMMANMSGMLPSGSFPSPGQHTVNETAEGTETHSPPEDVINAVRSGNVEDLMSLLRREHAHRAGTPVGDDADGSPRQTDDLSNEEKDVLDACMRIAAENNLSLDWVVLRALKTYISEYLRSGRL